MFSYELLCDVIIAILLRSLSSQMAEVLPNTIGAIESLSQSVQECLATFAPKLEGSSDSPNQYIAKTQFLCARLH